MSTRVHFVSGRGAVEEGGAACCVACFERAKRETRVGFRGREGSGLCGGVYDDNWLTWHFLFPGGVLSVTKVADPGFGEPRAPRVVPWQVARLFGMAAGGKLDACLSSCVELGSRILLTAVPPVLADA